MREVLRSATEKDRDHVARVVYYCGEIYYLAERD